MVAGGGRWGRCRRERRGAAVCLFAACGVVHGREAGAAAHAMVAAGVVAAPLLPTLALELVIAAV